MNEYGDVLNVFLQEQRDSSAAKRSFRRLIDDQELPERIITNTPFGAQVDLGATAQPLGKCLS